MPCSASAVTERRVTPDDITIELDNNQNLEVLSVNVTLPDKIDTPVA